ncbi:MAG TPA: CopD family protein [Nocardia sp.]|uniref:CopD family protein n=1 Tax=Nocardia sp. TaxID=1821 RepID=UPI002B4B6860|nr:CopD family protein [Nocardia sp.]HLS78586.1 CopD family protein [Nocardia sp.]
MSAPTSGRDAAALSALLPAGLLGVGLAWLLARPDFAPAAALIRVVADGTGATVLGLAALPRLHERLRTPWLAMAVLGGVWWVAEAGVLVCGAAEVVGVPVVDLGAGQFADYVGQVGTGRIGLAVLLGVAVLTGYSALAFRRDGRSWPAEPSADLVLVFAAVALALRPVTGHMSQQPLGSVLAAAHALAAAAWLGLLVALALVARGRAEWAAALPRYSALALPLAAVVATTGVLNGFIRLAADDPARPAGLVGTGLVGTGYGRVLLAKATVLVALLALGWWWRRDWVRRASGHRMSAGDSLRRAVLDAALMTIAFGLAAALAVTA